MNRNRGRGRSVLCAFVALAVLAVGFPDVLGGTAIAAEGVTGEVYLTNPTKILDTRSGLGAPKAPLGAGKTLTIAVAGKGGVPSSGASSAILQISTLTATAATALTVYPAGTARPSTPNLFVRPKRPVAVQLTSKLGTNGRVSIYNASGSVQLVAHTQGWSASAGRPTPGTRLTPLASRRILNTRSGLGAPKAAIGAGKTLTFTVAGKGGVPSTGVTAAGLNITATSASTKTQLTVFAAGTRRPATPNVFLGPKQTVSAAVLTKLGSGKVSIHNALGTVHVAADTQGAYRTSYASGGRLTPLRPASLAKANVGAGKTLVVQVTGKGGVPTATDTRAMLAVPLSVKATGTTATRTALTVYPYGAARPATPNLYLPKGAKVANAVLAKLGNGGKVAIHNSAGTTSVAVDTQGYYSVPIAAAPPPPPPPPPAEEITTTGAHSLYEEAKFLFTGTNPPQTGVAADTIKPDRIGVIRGNVRAGGAALAGATITILNHPQYGTTKTAADGTFSIAVNAGGPLVVDYAAAGHSSSQRQPVTKINQYVWVEDVALVPLDTKVSTVSPETATTTTAAVSSTVTDADGARKNAVLFPAGTTATAEKADGTVVELPATMSVRATEYTVGAAGPERMPGTLPASSAYTYATELSIDEATAAGAVNVEFSKPLANYVDNFLDFPVGTPVPAGYYDRQKAVWVASDDGVVVKIIAINDGVAQLDTNGDDVADNSIDGVHDIPEPERRRLATIYSTVGKTLWRVPIKHFTPWDYNWPYGLPDDATNWKRKCMAGADTELEAASCEAEAERLREEQCQQSGSIIGCQDQTLDQSVAVTGTKLNLRYSSGRAPGRLTDRRIRIPLTFDSMPATLRGVQLEIDVAGQHISKSFGTAPNQSYVFNWDGLDGYGRPVNGAQDVNIRIGYIYPAVYKASSEAFQSSFALAGGADLQASNGDPLEARQSITVWESLQTVVGKLRTDTAGLGGWTLDVHHAYDPRSRTVQLGNGSVRSAGAAAQGVIGTPALSGEQFSDPRDIAAAADGTLYVADAAANKIFKVSPAGAVSTFAGTGTAGYTGDGQQATLAKLYHPTHLAVGPDGSVYVTDGWDAQLSRVRRISPDGIIDTGAGIFDNGYNGDDKPAVDAALQSPAGIAVGLDGSLYIADTGNARIRRVNPDGIITTVAGNGDWGDAGDGGPAAEATITPHDVAVAADGSVFASTDAGTIRVIRPDGRITRFAGSTEWAADPAATDALQAPINPAFLDMTSDGTLRFSETSGNRVRAVTSDGRIATVIGDGTCDDPSDTGDGRTPDKAHVCSPVGVASTASGLSFVMENDPWVTDGNRIRRVGAIWPGFQLGDTTLSDPTGTQLWVFDANGRHKRTVDAMTGAAVWQFAYDEAGRLVALTDPYGNSTTIARNSAGAPLSITAPGGQITTLTTSVAGDLTSIKDPLGNGPTITYQAGGLMKTWTDAAGRMNTFTYDASGRLIKDEEPDGTFTTLDLQETDTQTTVVSTGPGGLITKYVNSTLADGRTRAEVISPTGSTRALTTAADGMSSRLLHPDGTVTVSSFVPDQRWGLQAPFAKSIAVTLPGGKTINRTATQEVTLSDPGNALSLTAMTLTDTVDGKTTTTTWDALSRTTTTTSPAGRTSSTTLDAKGRVSSYRVDAAVAPITYDYDARGRVVSEAHGSRLTTYGYDDANRMTSRTTADGTETFTYDAAGRITGLTTPGGKHYDYGYDAVGNRTSVTMPGGFKHDLGHSPLNQRTSYTPPGGDPYVTSYTGFRQVESTTMPSGAIQQRSYDAGGRETGVAYPGASTSISYVGTTVLPATESRSAGGVTESTQRAYDGPFLTSAAVSGSSVGTYSYTYDSQQLLASVRLQSGPEDVTTNLTHDADGLRTAEGDFTFDRSGPGGLTNAITDGTVEHAMNYDDGGHPTQRSMSVGGAPVYSSTTTYDAAGRVNSLTEQTPDGTTTSTYSYDEDGQLIGVDKDGTPIAAFEYDPRGNRIIAGDPQAPLSATYDAQDRLLTRGGTNYTFDEDGYLASRGSDSFTYSARGELASATVDGTTVTYAYDSKRRRVSRTTNGQTTQYLYGNPEQETLVTAVRTPDGQLTRLFYDGARHLYAMQRGGDRFYVATDQLGSPRVITDASGAVLNRIDYDVWGEVLSESDPTFDIPIGFAGGLTDELTGLLRFGLRDYEPAAGRWVARDPALFESGQSNLYVYVANSPASFVDPTGLWAFSLGGSICLGVCIEAKLTLGSNGFQACGGTGVGLGAGLDAGFNPGDVDTDSGLYAGAAASLGPLSAEVQTFQTVCGSSTSWSGCAAFACVDQDTFKEGETTVQGDPREFAEDIKDVIKPKLKAGLQAKATIGGCVGSEY